MKKFTEVKNLIASLEADADKFYNKGNSAAGTRVRKGMQDLKNLNSDGPTVGELANAPFPVMLLAGEKDAVLSPATVRRAGELLPNARVEVVPNAPHSMYWETPTLFNDAVARFLKEVAAA